MGKRGAQKAFEEPDTKATTKEAQAIARLPESLPLACQHPEMAGETLPIMGVDEAGRGPWAGPVVAAAVVASSTALTSTSTLLGVTDSKKLNEAQRELVYKELTNHPHLRWAVSVVGVSRIDKANILEAAHQAMTGAVRNLQRRLPSGTETSIVVDGNLIPKKLQKKRSRALIGGDRLCFEIAAASVIAKVTRDRLMMKLDQRFPTYGFAAHKGYGTAAHQAALVKHGPCSEHRSSFEPIKGFLATGRWRSRLARQKNLAVRRLR